MRKRIIISDCFTLLPYISLSLLFLKEKEIYVILFQSYGRTFYSMFTVTQPQCLNIKGIVSVGKVPRFGRDKRVKIILKCYFLTLHNSLIYSLVHQLCMSTLNVVVDLFLCNKP